MPTSHPASRRRSSRRSSAESPRRPPRPTAGEGGGLPHERMTNSEAIGRPSQPAPVPHRRPRPPPARRKSRSGSMSIDKRYPGVHALKDVSLAVRRGEVHAIVGENGAGKSTLVGVAAGTVVADSGRVEIDGETSDAPSPQWSRERGLAIVYQEPALLPDLTVAENMRLGMPRAPPTDRRPRSMHGRPRSWPPGATRPTSIHACTCATCGRTSASSSRSPGRWPSEPSILILDEPTEHLLPEGVEVLFTAIRQELAAWRRRRLHLASHPRGQAGRPHHLGACATVPRRARSRRPRSPRTTSSTSSSAGGSRPASPTSRIPPRSASPCYGSTDFSGPRFHSVSLACAAARSSGSPASTATASASSCAAWPAWHRSGGGFGGVRAQFASAAPPPPATRASATSPTTATAKGCFPGLNVRENLTIRALPRLHDRRHRAAGCRTAGDRSGRRGLRHQDALGRKCRRAPLRRKPAEGDAQPHHDVLTEGDPRRRADPGRRRRGAGRHLPAAAPGGLRRVVRPGGQLRRIRARGPMRQGGGVLARRDRRGALRR